MVKKICNECGSSLAPGSGWEIGRNTYFFLGRNTHFKKSVQWGLTLFLKVW
jgi:hypothetical protein